MSDINTHNSHDPEATLAAPSILPALSSDLIATLAASSALGETWVMSDQTLMTLPADPASAGAQMSAPHDVSASPESDLSKTLSETFGPSLIALAASKGIVNTPLQDQSGVLGTRFEVSDKLGAGAYGEVWRAKDQDLKRPVAIKRFLGLPQEALGACHDELKFVGRLDHPGVPSVYQAGLTAEGNPYLVMKLLEGESLQALINKLKAGDPLAHAAFPFTRRIELIIQLLRVVAASHRAGVLHRDIKPDNIYLGPEGEVSLIDWGIAEDMEEAKRSPKLCGTPLYMSPEQAQGAPIGRESDLFSVGVVAYELMCLHSCAPEGESVWDILKAIPTHQPRNVDLVFSESQEGLVPSEYAMAIMKALKRDPSERYAYAEEMIHQLQSSLDGVFDVVCPRTLLKRNLYRFSRWVDRRPYLSLAIVYLLVPALIIMFIMLGVFAGLAIAGT